MATLSDRVDEALGIAGRLVVLALGTALVVFLLGMVLKPALPLGLPRGEGGRALVAMMLAIALATATAIASVMLEGGRWEVAGLGRRAAAPARVLGGILLGLLVIVLPAAVLLLRGDASLAPTTNTTGWGAARTALVAATAGMALVEVGACHGYAFGVIRERWGRGAALLLTALLFAALHARHPALGLPAVAVAGALGLAFGAIRERTGSVAAAALAHVTADLVTVFVLHAPLDGAVAADRPWYAWTAAGVPLAGGRGGPLASPIAAATALAITFLVLRTPRRPAGRRARA